LPKKLKITQLYAFIAKDEKGNEGILSYPVLGDKGIPEWLVMIGADIERVESLKPIAEYIKIKTGRDYEIRYFKIKNK
jgi:hypothetical protein